MIINKVYFFLIVLVTFLFMKSLCLKNLLRTQKTIKTNSGQGGSLNPDKKPRQYSCSYFYECESGKCMSGLCL